MKVSTRLVILIGSSVSIIAIFTLSILLVVIRKRIESIHLEETNPTKKYKILNHNLQSGESNYGIISGLRNLDEDKFLSYINEEGNHVLISNFDSEEYLCSGSCSCENVKTRRMSNIVSRGITFLVASVSSALVIGQAKELFQKECTKTMSDVCSLSKVVSKVDSCQGVERKLLKKPAKVKLRKKQLKKFTCTGNCLMNGLIDRKDLDLHLAASAFGCKNLKRSATIEVTRKEMRFFEQDEITNERRVAREIFIRDYLIDYCTQKSLERYWSCDREKPDVPGRWVDWSFCEGVWVSGNPSVMCIPLIHT